MDWTGDDQPIWMTTRKGRILAMPYPVECNDTRGIVWYGHTAREFVDMLIDGFDEMLAQSEGQPLAFPISLHPFVMGRPYRVRHLRRFFEHITPHRDHVRYVGLVVIVQMSGDGRFGLCADRSGAGARVLDAGPGDAILMRAPGFGGSKNRPFHFLDGITVERYSLGIRSDKTVEPTAD